MLVETREWKAETQCQSSLNLTFGWPPEWWQQDEVQGVSARIARELCQPQAARSGITLTFCICFSKFLLKAVKPGGVVRHMNTSNLSLLLHYSIIKCTLEG